MGYNRRVQKLKQWSVFSFLLLVFLASSWSLLINNGFFRVHDFTHAGRIVEMARALQDGHFPVRWTENFGYGYGMPLFEFYGPLPFYVGALFFLIFGNVIWSIKFLYLLVNFGTLMGGYCLGKKLYGRAGGLLVATFLTLAPYRAMNLFARGALNEVWGIMFLSWILFGLIKIFHQEKNGWKFFTLSLIGLFLSHNITTMIFLPVLALFALFYMGTMYFYQRPELFRKSQFRLRNFLRISWQLFASGLLAVGAASFYLLPAFLEKNYTQVEKIILTYYFDFRLHFLYIRQFFNSTWGYGGSGWGTDDGISFFLGWGQLLTLIIFLLLWFKQICRFIFKRNVKQSSQISARSFWLTLSFGVLTLFTLFMSLLKSQFVWEQIEIFKFIQFPWRWLSSAIVFLALLLGSISWLFTNVIVRAWVAGIVVVISVIGSVGFFRPDFYLDNPVDFYYTDPSRIRNELSGILPDYISSDMEEKPSIIPDQLIINHEDLDAEKYDVLVDRTHEKLIKTSFSTPTKLELAVATYPGWKTEIDGQWWNNSKGVVGNIQIEAPAGEHLVSLRFENTWLRTYSDLISLFSWLILIYLFLPKNIIKKKN
ncbi:MAG: hypothetical protein AUK08_01500 [Candidatus Pacebacteria bacterium CG2_30_36_39]|nr:MAG: hypothetical protein AUK08_01500 [Candidatus Pacebacteria bacterium CG2_30_36_39]